MAALACGWATAGHRLFRDLRRSHVRGLILACLLEEQITEAADGDAREEVPLDRIGEMGALAESGSIQQGRARRLIRTLGDQLDVAVIQRVRQGRADSGDVDTDDLPGGNAGAVARAARRLALGWSQATDDSDLTGRRCGRLWCVPRGLAERDPASINEQRNAGCRDQRSEDVEARLAVGGRGPVADEQLMRGVVSP